MRAVIQRVSTSSVGIGGSVHASISKGLLVLLGVEEIDTTEDVDWLSAKIIQLRIFDDTQGVMNLSVQDVQGEILVISQFTLHASTKKGNRPSYIRAARPEKAIPLYEAFCEKLRDQLKTEIKTGIFGADMQVSLVNDGPVTILMDSRQKE